MIKKDNLVKKEPAKSPPKIKYEDTKEFMAYDHMMRDNRYYPQRRYTQWR